MATQADIDWVKLRLPAGASFVKNGVTTDIDTIVADEIDGADSRALALASLLDILAANQTFESEQMADYQYSGPKLAEQAAAIREAEGVGAGSFSFVPAIFKPESVTDENSA